MTALTTEIASTLVARMVDYEWWLTQGKPTDTTLDEQVRVMAQIAAQSPSACCASG
jgi:hypothetical protein